MNANTVNSYVFVWEIRGGYYTANHTQNHIRVAAALQSLRWSVHALCNYEERGLGDCEEALLRMIGFFQSIILQQDAISKLFSVFCHQKISHAPTSAWRQMRALRNLTIGHPVKHDRPVIGAFISEQMGNILAVTETEKSIAHISILSVITDGRLVISIGFDEGFEVGSQIELRPAFQRYKREAIKALCRVIRGARNMPKGEAGYIPPLTGL